MTQHFIQLFKGVFVSSLPYISLDPCLFQFVDTFGPLRGKEKTQCCTVSFNGTLLDIHRVAKCENYTSKELCAQIFLFFCEG